MSKKRNYEKRPAIDAAGTAERGWPSVLGRILKAPATTLVVDCYPGVDVAEIRAAISQCDATLSVFDCTCAMRPHQELACLLERFITQDRVFGYMSPFQMAEFFDATRCAELQTKIREAAKRGRVAVVGVGASVVWEGNILVYADLPRWELQLRYRRGMPNWTADNPKEDFLKKYKRGYFVEWRTADRHKMEIFDKIGFFGHDTPARPRLVEGDTYRQALLEITSKPFRVVPFFDPGVWGGQRMRRKFDLPDDQPNYAWGFDCVPEENSILFSFNGVDFESPSLNVVLRYPRKILGEKVYSRFGAEFPIRFDFLDTIEGENLSLQVHPTTDYIRQAFGMSYTQDESYYMLEARPEAAVYLGMKSGATVTGLFHDIEIAQAGGPAPDVEKYVNKWPAKKHDHFSIPAGTIHCAGSGCLILEISATPYIFTFKLWDWGRTGLDGLPRPVHLDHGRRVLQENQNTEWVQDTILSLRQNIGEGDGWREERTGLHEWEFIETRRHWFTKPVNHDTRGNVNVINLVAGDWATIESPTRAFAPFRMNYAETVIIPAAVGPYRVVPSTATEHATLRACVRI